MAESAKESHDSVLARMVVEQGLATAEEVEKCRQLQQEHDGENGHDLAATLVSEGVATQGQLARVKPQIAARKGGQQIPGFKILERLGAGAMATVYRARQLSLDRMVAVKILPRRFTNNPQFVKRFYAEGRAAAKLNHPNIVGALDVGKAGEFHYFVMEYVEGKTVFDELTEKGVYEESKALEVIIQVAHALEHAHAAGLVHRDVKPKNIMIAKTGEVKLADMGLARAVSDREAAEAEKGKAFGTPYYISPEQVRGDTAVDLRADLYSLGCTLYHMVTGRVPFDGANPSVVMHKHLKAELTPPDHINPSLSAGIGEVIEVCMAKDRNQRYATATDLLDDLEALARGEPPMQARRKFDFASLSALEASAVFDPSVAESNGHPARRSAGRPSQGVFWAAIVGWVVVLILTIVLVVLHSAT